jgi:hypothetical protein
MSRLPDGLIAFGPNANCTLEICPAEWSILGYQPSLAASGLFIALFALAGLVHAGHGIYFKTWGFMSMTVVGCIFEILGYAARIILRDNPFSFVGFLIQISAYRAPLFLRHVLL